MSQNNSAQRDPMRTIGGMSVRGEIDARLQATWHEAHQQGIEDAVAFLEASGHSAAAQDLQRALEEAVQRHEAA